jgi:hypothetical protein
MASNQRIRLSEVIDRWPGLTNLQRALYAVALSSEELEAHSHELRSLTDRQLAELFAYRNESLVAIGVQSLEFFDEIREVEHLGDLILQGCFAQMAMPLEAFAILARDRDQVVDRLPSTAAAYALASTIRGLVADLHLLSYARDEPRAAYEVFVVLEPDADLDSAIKRVEAELYLRGTGRGVVEKVEHNDRIAAFKIKKLLKPEAVYLAEWLDARSLVIDARAYLSRSLPAKHLAAETRLEVSS